jgi:hypothetical protein
MDNSTTSTGSISLMDKLVGDEGIKTSVTVSLEPDIYIKLGVTIVLSIGLSLVAANLLKQMMNKQS